MSWLDDSIDQAEAASQEQRFETTREMPSPGAFSGGFDALGKGLVRGAIEGVGATEALFALSSANLAAMNLSAEGVFLHEPDASGELGLSPIDDAERKAARERVGTIGAETARATIDLRPDPTTTGVVGQILGEAAAILPRAVVGGVAGGPIGAAIAAGAPAGFAGKYVGIAEGLDESTATLKGVIDALTIGGGALLPAARFVKPLLGDFAIAVGANTALGMAQRGVTAELLEGGGYTQQAAQYRAMDGAAIATDAILGAAFFGIGRASLRRPTPEQVDAALTERATQHYDVDTAPGAPINPRSAVAHQAAIKAAIRQLSRGEPVTLPESIHNAEFLRPVDDILLAKPNKEQAQVIARQELEPALRAELEQEAQNLLPNVADIRAELGAIEKTIGGLDATFRGLAKAAQEQGQSRKRAETTARRAIEQRRQELTERQTALTDELAGNRQAELARAELAAMDRGEIPQRLQSRIEQEADAIIKGFEPRKLAVGVREGQFNIAQVAREEIDRIRLEMERIDPLLQARPLEEIRPATREIKPTEKVIAAPAEKAAEVTEADRDPTVLVAGEILARVEDMQLATGAIDADGIPITVSARELMARADVDIQQAQADSRGFAAAAACFLQRGEV